MIEYVILTNNCSDAEIKSRLNFCVKTFNLSFLIQKDTSAIKYISFPKTKNKYLFLVGHNTQIYKYLIENNREIDNLIIVSCSLPQVLYKDIRANKIYVSNTENNMTNYYDGRNWGFNFIVTNDELSLYNSNEKEIDKKIINIFRRIK